MRHDLTEMSDKAPIGIVYINKYLGQFCKTKKTKETFYKIWVLLLTFLCYCSYHLSRKPPSVVKNALNKNCSGLNPPDDIHITNETKFTWCDWAPFNGPNSDALLGMLDSAFLIGYAIAMFFSGFLAERMNLRYFLSLGMLLSGVFTYLFGLGYYLQIHSYVYYVIIQVLCGVVQSSGWPGVVTCVANWFGKGNRGVIFGIWNSHTSVGNIVGSLIAGMYVDKSWGLSFIFPALIIACMGFICFLLMVSDPEQVGLPRPVDATVPSAVVNRDSNDEAEEETETLLSSEDENATDVEAISFGRALLIPGVIEFSLCLFFSKLVSYTFLYWLPRYIKLTSSYDAEESADLSALFDVGGIAGAIIAGFISDRSLMSATTCSVMLVLAIPLLLLFSAVEHISLTAMISMLIIVGVMVNGPYALITTSVSADLGTHPSIRGNAKALATVSAIIDGTGSVGAAVGPFLAGVIVQSDLDAVFSMLCVANVLALLFLVRQVKQEVYSKYVNRKNRQKRQS